MFLVRDIMYCKPGQARPMAQKFLALGKFIQGKGYRGMRVMTDLTAERYWTVVAEMEVETMQQYEQLMQQSTQMKEAQDIMQGYHDHVVQGRREIYKIES